MSKSAEHENLQKLMTEIFKTDWLTELLSDIFKFIENSYSLWMNSQFKAGEPNVKM